MATQKKIKQREVSRLHKKTNNTERGITATQKKQIKQRRVSQPHEIKQREVSRLHKKNK